ncbi:MULTISPECIES: hypothetical protein [unclassified Enterococcus]|uniref:hypothetical protein n=1 Tax=unclassified Enterococcus TaxID=2608891 RepID=UPI000B762F9A|nr:MULTISPECIES: hypothetical protein [unclassified Enterococcus]OTO77219.1 hypothetical protein A5865_001094 [Enterococcus sp. 12E11_DIV0728]OUZ16619.1 hypothetical protein A5868_001541 [Enterococcus sp. 12F9_DIV0723]
MIILVLLLIFIVVALYLRMQNKNKSEFIYWEKIDELEKQRKEMILQRARERQNF